MGPKRKAVKRKTPYTRAQLTAEDVGENAGAAGGQQRAATQENLAFPTTDLAAMLRTTIQEKLGTAKVLLSQAVDDRVQQALRRHDERQQASQNCRIQETVQLTLEQERAKHQEDNPSTQTRGSAQESVLPSIVEPVAAQITSTVQKISQVSSMGKSTTSRDPSHSSLPELQRLATRLITEGIAPSTTAAYNKVWTSLQDFCSRIGNPQWATPPITPATVLLFLSEKFSTGCTGATLTTYSSALAYVHKFTNVQTQLHLLRLKS